STRKAGETLKFHACVRASKERSGKRVKDCRPCSRRRLQDRRPVQGGGFVTE
ncbi:hypothetical protein KI387_027061, partial [Taxus chinensis]